MKQQSFDTWEQKIRALASQRARLLVERDNTPSSSPKWTKLTNEFRDVEWQIDLLLDEVDK